ncbi:MAG: hypothetical protein HQL15_10400 [Candidatus Omnitrophica bacterium]|nr:hypothetical protein [Candidatus Omnitrophota bacterium]
MDDTRLSSLWFILSAKKDVERKQGRKMWTEMIGWIGMVFSMATSVPQFVKSVKERSTMGLSLLTYQILFAAVACYLVRAIAIREPVFIASGVANLILTSGMMYLFKKYPEHS